MEGTKVVEDDRCDVTVRADYPRNVVSQNVSPKFVGMFYQAS